MQEFSPNRLRNRFSFLGTAMKTLLIIITFIFLIACGQDTGSDFQNSSSSSSYYRTFLLCDEYTFRGGIYCNEIDGIKVLSKEECRSMGGEIKEVTQSKQEAYYLRCTRSYAVEKEDGHYKDVYCLANSTCTDNVSAQFCSNYGGKAISSKECSLYSNGQKIIVHCNSSFGCEPQSVTGCLNKGGKQVSVCKGYEDYGYCDRDGLCSYISANDCYVRKGTQTKNSCY